MARGKKTGGKDFKRDNPGRPMGARDKVQRGFTKALFERFFGDPTNMDVLYGTLQKAARNPKHALQMLQIMGDRLEGKPKQDVGISTKHTTIFREAPPAATPLPEPRKSEEGEDGDGMVSVPLGLGG